MSILANPPVIPSRVNAAQGLAAGLHKEFLEAARVAIYATDAQGGITYYNEAAAELWGTRPEIGKSKFCGSWKLYRSDGTILPHDECPMALTLKHERPIRGWEVIAERPDGSRVPLMPFPTPLFDGTAACVGAVNILVDISERKVVEETLARHMEEHVALFRLTDGLYRAASRSAIYDAALDAILEVLRCGRASILLFDESGVMRFAAWRGLADDYRKAVEGHSPWTRDERDPQPIFLHDVEAAELSDSLKSVLRSEGIGALSFVPIVADGALVGKFMAYYPAPHEFTQGERDLAITIARQLGFGLDRLRADEARSRAVEQQRLLLHEMNHRVKNLLTIAAGIVSMSARSATDAGGLAESVRERLQALARAHDLILPKAAGENYGETTLRELVDAVLAPYAGTKDPEGRPAIAVSGPDVPIGPDMAKGLALVLHELATNAFKYGSLSAEDGTIRIEWSTCDDGLVLRWTESGGPSLDAPPDEAGFGSRLLKATINGQLGGQIVRSWTSEGLAVEISLPQVC